MRYLLIVALLVAGCGKEEKKPGKFSPSAIHSLTKLPDGEITVEGKLIDMDIAKAKATEGKVFIVLVDDIVAMNNNELKKLWVVFESNHSGFTEDFKSWMRTHYDGFRVVVKGKLIKIDGTFYLSDSIIVH